MELGRLCAAPIAPAGSHASSDYFPFDACCAYVALGRCGFRELGSEARNIRLSDVNRFKELVLPHVDAAHDVANELTRNPDDAEDVVQEACVRALKYIAALHGDDARAWFLTIVRHAFYDWCKRNRPAEIARDDGTAIEMAIDDAAIDPEQAALRGAESRLLANAVAELPLVYREVLILRELEELSYKEIARIADIPVGTVMSRLARARSLLQRSPLMHVVGERTSGGLR
jgi:RNA polymerase sigma-70 factor (ECF subfamily)